MLLGTFALQLAVRSSSSSSSREAPSAALPAALTFTADVSHVVTAVDRTPVGATLEDTSMSLYGGGLYSQLIYGESFEEPRLEGVGGQPGYLTWAAPPPTKSRPCHMLIPGRSKLPADSPFNGRQSLRLSAADGICQINNMGGGGDRWGVALTAGHTFSGYLFSRGSGVLRVGLCGAGSSSPGGTMHMNASSCYCSHVLPAPTTPSHGGWAMRNISLSSPSTDSVGAFVIWAESGVVDIDSVFLEDEANLYPGAAHVRRDLAAATLLNGSLQFMRFGGDMAGRSTYAWRTMRGPAWLRPPQTPGSWSPFSSNGWGLLEFLQFREAAGIGRVILGTSSGLPGRALGKCARPADSPASMADLAEYLFAPLGNGSNGSNGSNSSALAQLRASDGHPEPYASAGLVIEIGNECKCDQAYFPGFNLTVSSVVERVRATAPQVGVLSFSSMAGVIMERDCSASNNAALADIVTFWAARNVAILQDSHIPSEVGASGFSQAWQTLKNLSRMVADMRVDHGAPSFRFFVGEENCASDKHIANDPLCHGLGRALLHALYANGLHRMGSDTCLGVASATLYGASGRQFEWPQAGIEFTADAVLLQPPFYVKKMVGDSYRGAVLHSTPSSYNTSQCSNPSLAPPSTGTATDGCQIVDLLVLKPSAAGAAPSAADSDEGLVIRIVSSLQHPINVTVELQSQHVPLAAVGGRDHCARLNSLLGGSSGSGSSAAADDASGGGWSCAVLACDGNISAANALDHPTACAPHTASSTVARWAVTGAASFDPVTGACVVNAPATVELTLDAYSFTVCTAQPSRRHHQSETVLTARLKSDDSYERTIHVGASSTANASTIGSAVSLVPLYQTVGWTIVVEPGVYRERVFILPDSGPITIRGMGRAEETVLVYHCAGTGNGQPDCPRWDKGDDIECSPRNISGVHLLEDFVQTLYVAADNFVMLNMTVSNDACGWNGALRGGSPTMRTMADKSFFQHVRILGGQDTLYTGSECNSCINSSCINSSWSNAQMGVYSGLDGCHDHGQGNCPTDFPFPSASKEAAERKNLCYKSQSEAAKGEGPCGSWCTKDVNVGSGCGINTGRICGSGSSCKPAPNIAECEAMCDASSECNAINYNSSGVCCLESCPYVLGPPKSAAAGCCGYYRTHGGPICNRQYFLRSYINGSCDSIFGSSNLVLDRCDIGITDHITAMRGNISRTGHRAIYLFFNSSLVRPLPTDSNYKYSSPTDLGRPWAHPGHKLAYVVHVNTWMDTHISSSGWGDWGQHCDRHPSCHSDPTCDCQNITYAEYRSHGPGATPAKLAARPNWTYQLSEQGAAVYTPLNVMYGWEPKVDNAVPTAPTTDPALLTQQDTARDENSEIMPTLKTDDFYIADLPSAATKAPPGCQTRGCVVTVSLAGPLKIVYNNSKTRCYADGQGCDNADTPARAFVDGVGMTHLNSVCSTARLGTGPSLKHIRHNCSVVFQSALEKDPSMFADREWIHATRVLDKNTIFALVHNEYHGDEPGHMCTVPLPLPPRSQSCAFNAVTSVLSTDGGYSWYHSRPPPGHLVAAVPYTYPGNSTPWFGWGDTGGILRNPKDGYFYTTAYNRHTIGAQSIGTCLMRTRNLTEPGSWRGWDGREFNVSFVNPYVLQHRGGDPQRHVCVPLKFPAVTAGREELIVQGLVWSTYLKMFVAVIRVYCGKGPHGTYDGLDASPLMFSVSDDLISWSALRPLYSPQPYADWWVNYPTLLDPSAPARGDLNFETIGQTAVLYFSWAPQVHNWRSLVSVPVRFFLHTTIENSENRTTLKTDGFDEADYADGGANKHRSVLEYMAG